MTENEGPKADGINCDKNRSEGLSEVGVAPSYITAFEIPQNALDYVNKGKEPIRKRAYHIEP